MNYSMISDNLYKRKCDKCKMHKDLMAFVGGRSTCRGCWVSLSSEEKRELILNEKALISRKARKLLRFKTA